MSQEFTHEYNEISCKQAIFCAQAATVDITTHTHFCLNKINAQTLIKVDEMKILSEKRELNLMKSVSRNLVYKTVMGLIVFVASFKQMLQH